MGFRQASARSVVDDGLNTPDGWALTVVIFRSAAQSHHFATHSLTSPVLKNSG